MWSARANEGYWGIFPVWNLSILGHSRQEKEKKATSISWSRFSLWMLAIRSIPLEGTNANLPHSWFRNVVKHGRGVSRVINSSHKSIENEHAWNQAWWLKDSRSLLGHVTYLVRDNSTQNIQGKKLKSRFCYLGTGKVLLRSFYLNGLTWISSTESKVKPTWFVAIKRTTG